MRVRKNRVYTAYITQALAVAPGGVGGGNIQIPNRNRVAKLLSLSYDIRIESLNVMLPLEQNTTQEHYITLFAFPGSNLFAETVEPQAGFAGVVGNGTNLRMSRPGQLRFNSFFVQNLMMITVGYINHDLLNTYNYEMHIAVELEDVEVIG
jgi:hypothetical protein